MIAPADFSALSTGVASEPAPSIVMFGGPTDWTGAWYSRHQLSAGLSRRHRVILVEDPTEWRAALARPGGFTRAARLVEEPVGTLRYSHPGWLPQIYRIRSVRQAFNRLRSKAMCERIDAGGAGPKIAYVWHPNYVEAVAPLAGWPLVYHAYDRYDHYTGGSKEEGLPRETWLAQRASICIAASARLAEHLRNLGARDVRLLRHGVDAAFFQSGRSVPDELARIPRPRLGLVASLTEANDYRALHHIARSKPDWSLVIVGKKAFISETKRAEFEELERLPNVHFIGFRPREEVPAWVSGLDVALVCYDLTTWAPFNQPLKLYEYLACGVPVVASDILAARELGDLVHCAKSPDHWIPAIEAVIASDSPDLRKRRRAFAQENGWEQRIADLEQILSGLVAAPRRHST